MQYQRIGIKLCCCVVVDECKPATDWWFPYVKCDCMLRSLGRLYCHRSTTQQRQRLRWWWWKRTICHPCIPIPISCMWLFKMFGFFAAAAATSVIHSFIYVLKIEFKHMKDCWLMTALEFNLNLLYFYFFIYFIAFNVHIHLCLPDAIFRIISHTKQELWRNQFCFQNFIINHVRFHSLSG